MAALPENARSGGETSARQVFDRMAGTWTYWGWKGGYFDAEEDASAFYDEIRLMLARQMGAPNSPQWFNTGLYWAYGIDGPAQGHWYVDYRTGELMASASAYEHPQPHACFIQSVADDLVNEGGIMDLWVREARIFKYGSGSGSNFSKLRGEGERLSGGGRSSGLMSFLRIGDRAAGAIKSGGTTRRAAKMVIVDIDHPDIETFIDWKVVEEQKVAALVAGSKLAARHLKRVMAACREVELDASADPCDPAQNPALKREIRAARRAMIPEAYIQRVLQSARQGETAVAFRTYDTDWDSEAYLTVAGQNSNNSVRVSNAFLDCVAADGNVAIDPAHRRQNRQDAAGARLVGPHRLRRLGLGRSRPAVRHDDQRMAHLPRKRADQRVEPVLGIQFPRRHRLQPRFAEPDGVPRAREGGFDAEGFAHAVRLWTIVLEISVMMAQFPSAEIARRSFAFRTLGLGYANLGGLLMAMGIAYDSAAGRALGAAITALLTGASYAASAEMAGDPGLVPRGAFPGYAVNREPMLRVIRNHRRAAYGESAGYEGLSIPPVPLDAANCPDPRLVAAARESWDAALALGEKHGFRNAQATVIAPTGTIGLVMDCDTTGIEPDFALVKFKKLAGGGYFKIINRAVPPALAALGYDAAEIAAIERYALGPRHPRRRPRGQPREPARAQVLTTARSPPSRPRLAAAFDIKFAFNKWTFGEEFCVERLGITAAGAGRSRASTCSPRSASAAPRSTPPTPGAAAR